MTYIPHTEAERSEMLKAVGVARLEDLFAHLPEAVRSPALDAPPGLGEMELSAELERLASKNRASNELACFLGAGAYDHFIPPAVMELISRGELYTAYTPYQPEISQGVLQLIYEYQTMIATLAGCDVANASLYDGATALVEGVQMALRQTGRMGLVLADGAIHPHYLATLRTNLTAMGVKLEVVPPDGGGFESALGALGEKAAAAGDALACVAVGYPNFYGAVADLSKFAELVHGAGALLVASSNPFAFGVLKPPGKLGADIVCGEAQALGVPLQYGGPYLGYVASTAALVRRMPGRLVGQTVDVQGRRAFTLTLQAREQHIRREKATSNICTNEALCAMMAHFYMSCLGQRGLERAGELCLSKADLLRRRLRGLAGTSGAAIKDVPEYAAFHEFVVETRRPAREVLAGLLKKKILGGLDLGRYDPKRAHEMLVCVTEKRTAAEIEAYVEALAVL
ncbi:MAG: aminomethyl-transferring glycine dehydrogenase subunit GcvPA [Planctomycetota bacterium]|nr:aminomethyl-transferring glycine dehydrogenase subunit GcvPA [Planctomycetota bacterium]